MPFRQPATRAAAPDQPPAHQSPLRRSGQNATVDWHKRESARARMRVLVKRVLKKYGYPPDLSEEAVKLVLEQAEALLRQVG